MGVELKIGCCGFPVSMKRYFENFGVVEVQKTFYKPPSEKTAERWRKSAPSDFEFTIKAWQVITHPPSSPTFRKADLSFDDCGFFKPIREVFDAWQTTRRIAKILKAKIILFQTPKSFRDTKESIENMFEFFGSIEREFIFAFEPRGWREDSIRFVCEELDLIHATDPFTLPPLHGDILYFRLHGVNYSYRHRYSDEELERLKEMCVKDGYVMFNNTHMFEDAKRFKRLISGE